MPSAWCPEPLTLATLVLCQLNLEQILTHSQDSPQDVLWLSPGVGVGRRSGFLLQGAFPPLVSSQDRDSPSPSPCSSTDSRAQSLVQIDGVLDRQGTQQWPGVSHVPGRVTGHCVQSPSSPLVTSLTSYFLSEPSCSCLCLCSPRIFVYHRISWCPDCRRHVYLCVS